MNIRLFCLLLVICASSLRAQDERTFTSDPFSLSISAPRSWKLIPASFPTEEYELRNKNLFDLVKTNRNLPIVRIVKPVEGNRTISPAVQVFVEPDEGKTPLEFLLSASKSAAAGFEDFRITKKAADTTLNGIKAASIESAFTVAYSGGRSFPSVSRLWVIPRDKMMFVIAVTGQPDDLKALTNDIEFILRSVRFTSEQAQPDASGNAPASRP